MPINHIEQKKPFYLDFVIFGYNVIGLFGVAVGGRSKLESNKEKTKRIEPKKSN